MRFRALAADYDGTLAHEGRIDDETILALSRLRNSGCRLMLVTGRRREELEICPRLDLFDRVVAENGALVFAPAAGVERSVGERPPNAFLQRLLDLDISPLAVGRVIVAARRPHEVPLARAIREFDLKLELIFNKRSVMALPVGVDKASGLLLALEEMDIPAQDVVSVGDAENDVCMLRACGLGVAVANALPELFAQADLVTRAERGAGVVELIRRIFDDDLPRREHPTTSDDASGRSRTT